MHLPSLVMTGSSVIVGLNGALQKRFVLPRSTELIPGNVLRAAEVQSGVGGKGQDVAITLSCLQYDANLQVAQFIGMGAEGDTVHKMLSDLLGNDAMKLTVRQDSGMRTCTSIVASGTTTELVEPSGMIQVDEMNELMKKLENLEASALCIMGSMPPGCDEDTYAKIYEKVATPSTLCLIDSMNGLEPLLQRIAATPNHGPTILKLNVSELCKLANVKKSNNEEGGVLPDELVRAVLNFLEIAHPAAARALSAIAITDGAHPGYMAVMPVAEEAEFRLFELPVTNLMDKSPRNLSLTLYPIGAGDAVAAGTLAAWKSLTAEKDAPPCVHTDVHYALAGNESPTSRVMLAAFAFGLACGSASCLQEQNSVLKIDDALLLYNKEGRPSFVSSNPILTSSKART